MNVRFAVKTELPALFHVDMRFAHHAQIVFWESAQPAEEYRQDTKHYIYNYQRYL